MNNVKNKCVNCGKEIITVDDGDYVCSHVCQNEYTNKTTPQEDVHAISSETITSSQNNVENGLDKQIF